MKLLLIQQIWGVVSGSVKDPGKRTKTLAVLLIGLVLYGMVKYDAWRTQQIKAALSTSQMEQESLQRALDNLQTLTRLDDIIAREVNNSLRGYQEQTDVLIEQVLDDVRRIQTEIPTQPTGSVGERIVLERETVREVAVTTRSDRVAERLLVGMWDAYCRDSVGDPRLCAERDPTTTR